MEDFRNEEFNKAEELSHSDKLVGVFTNPRETFSQMALSPAKNIDWAIPIFIVIILTILSTVLIMSNPVIRSQVIEKQMELIEENFDKAVEDGQISRGAADQQLEQIRGNIDAQMNAGMIIQLVGTFVFVFVIFFIVTALFFVIAKFIFKDEGTYSSSLVSYGLPQYILALQVIIIIIASLATDKLIMGTSAAVLLDSDTGTLGGFLLSKVDPFRIWFYATISLAYAKMFKSSNTLKYTSVIFGLWLGVAIIIFFLSQSIPFLRPFAL